jgi:YfiH family protein
MHTSGFHLNEMSGVRYYSCAALEGIPALRHAFSTRRGGISPAPEQALNLGYVPWDSPANVTENRRRFLAVLGLSRANLATVAQFHSAEFHIINCPAHQWNPQTRGDALLTARQGIALAVQVADCFPVLLADAKKGIIAAVHAGWRGSLARILRRVIDGMGKMGADPADILATIGPGIRNCCLEVGPEVSSAFDAAFPEGNLCQPHPERRDKCLLDLPAALQLQLSESDVPQQNRCDLGLCTRCNPEEFFSYRAEGSHAGRMMGIIYQGVGDAPDASNDR